MRTIERIGEWFIDAGWLWLACFLLIGILGMSVYASNHSVVIPDTQFQCTATDAVGITARCTQFTMKGMPKSIANREE
jgi:hypothetical protein